MLKKVIALGASRGRFGGIMRKPIVFAAIALVAAVFGFIFGRYPAPLSASKVVSISSPDDLRALRDNKVAALAAILSKMTDADSARKHLPEAQTAFLEMSLVSARANMLGRDNGVSVWPSMKEPPFSDLRTQLDRISKAEDVSAELTPALDSLFSISNVRVARSTGKNSLRSTLLTLRSNLDLYKRQHNDKYPDLKTFGWSQLTQKTTASGAIADAALAKNNPTFGPYLQQLPVNPYTDSSKVTVLSTVPSDFKAIKGNAFVFEESTGRIHAIGPDGKLFDDSPKADIR
jgi:hypothetical protein